MIRKRKKWSQLIEADYFTSVTWWNGEEGRRGKLQEKHPASSQRGKKRAGNTCIFDFLLGFSVYLMAAIRTRRQSWRFGLDLPSRVRGSPFSFLAEERRGGKVHMPYSCTFRLLRTFWSWTPPGNRDYLPEQFFFPILRKIFFDESSIAITETCFFSLEKLKLRGKLDLDRISSERMELLLE